MFILFLPKFRLPQSIDTCILHLCFLLHDQAKGFVFFYEPYMSYILLYDPSEPRVQGIPQTISHHVKSENHQHDGETGRK